MKIFSTFLTINISKLNFWLVICIAKNFIWTTLKMIFSIYRFFCTLRFQIYKYCPIITNHTSMERLMYEKSWHLRLVLCSRVTHLCEWDIGVCGIWLCEVFLVSQALYQSWVLDSCRNILAILEDFPSLRPPIDHLCELLPRLQARYYSIASSSKVRDVTLMCLFSTNDHIFLGIFRDHSTIPGLQQTIILIID